MPFFTLIVCDHTTFYVNSLNTKKKGRAIIYEIKF